MVGAVTGRPVTVAVPAVLAWQQSVERVEQVVVRSGPDLEDDDAGRGVGDEHRQQAILRLDVGEERDAGRREIGDAARGPGADRQSARLYGKMLRRASRRRPMPPIAGADS